MSARGSYRIPEHVVSRRVGDDTVLLNLESGTYFSVESVGARVWELIGAGRTIDEINATVLEEYDVGADVLHRDVAELVQELERNGLVTAQ